MKTRGEHEKTRQECAEGPMTEGEGVSEAITHLKRRAATKEKSLVAAHPNIIKTRQFERKRHETGRRSETTALRVSEETSI